MATNERRIAIVEDNADSRLLVHAILRQYELSEYEDGATALDGMRQTPPDLVILDVSLPGMDGCEILEKMRADSMLANIPVIVLTAHAMAGDREKYLQLGFSDYVSKPITDVDAFRRTVAEHVTGATS